MNRRPLSLAAMLALGVVGTPAPVRAGPPPPADDRKPLSRSRRASGGDFIPFEHLKHVAVPVVNAWGSRDPADSARRTDRRRSRMRLRKRRGWR